MSDEDIVARVAAALGLDHGRAEQVIALVRETVAAALDEHMRDYEHKSSGYWD